MDDEKNEQERDLLKERWSHFVMTGETISHEDMKAWFRSLSPDYTNTTP